MASYPTLPLLDDEDLLKVFGNDAEGIRRYRIIHAVLVAGASQREAAEIVGVSERTVRNVLQLYRREGSVERLRSRTATARRVSAQRSDLFEPALAAALAEAPTAGGDRLWRQACAVLGAEARNLSRRTAYRIIARLRAERERTVDQSEEVSELRAALTLLSEDPPLSLGASSLATRLFSAANEPLRRGLLVRHVLTSAIERLRPSGEVDAGERAWWPYLICHGEYALGESRAELQAELALSPSTYSRAKRQALAQISARLDECLVALHATPDIRASQHVPLPRTADFVGRHDEQAVYSWRLQTEGMAYIWGLPGCGKTALAAELAADARRCGQRVCWYTCATPLQAQPALIARSILASLTNHELASELPVDPTKLFALLADTLSNAPTLVVIDDAFRIAEADSNALLSLLHELVMQRGLRLLIVGGHPPLDTSWPALRGLSYDEAYPIVADVVQPGAAWQALYTATGGFPQPLHLVAVASRQTSAAASGNEWHSIERWATTTIWQQLTLADQRALAATYGLARQPWAAQHQCITDVLGVDAGNLAALMRCGLLIPHQQQFRVHPLVETSAAARFEADAELREQCETFADCTECITSLPMQLDSRPRQDVVQSHSREPGAELALIDRLRLALDQSVAYLAQGADQQARQLAMELALLQAALPIPQWRRNSYERIV